MYSIIMNFLKIAIIKCELSICKWVEPALNFVFNLFRDDLCTNGEYHSEEPCHPIGND